MLRVASNALIVPPFECAWLSLQDYQLEGACCLQFECKGDNDVTIILKPVPGAKRWQHLQRQQGPAGGEHLAVEENYTVILGSHRNSKLKIEKNGDEKASATGLPGCTVSPQCFSTCWINYADGTITIGTGPAGSSISFQWRDPDSAITDIRHIGLSSWDKHVSYRSVNILPPLPPQKLQEQLTTLQEQQQWLQEQHTGQNIAATDDAGAAASARQPCASPFSTASQQLQQNWLQLQTSTVAPLLQLVQDSIKRQLTPASVLHVLQLSELLLPRTQQLYDAAVQLAGSWFSLLARKYLDDIAGLSLDLLADILQEPLLDVPELSVFEAVAAWCQVGQHTTASIEAQTQQLTTEDSLLPHDQSQQQQLIVSHRNQAADSKVLQDKESAVQAATEYGGLGRSTEDMLEVLQLVRFAFMTEADRQAVLDHPFSKECSLVQQCMQEDLQHLSDSTSSSVGDKGAYTFEQRRLMRPAGSLGSGPVAAVAAAGGGGTGKAAYMGQQQRAQSADSSLQLTGTIAGRSNDAGLGSMLHRTIHSCLHNQQSSCIRMPAGQAGCSNSTGSRMNRRDMAQKRYRRRLAPSCRELMYVCDGDKNGVIHHIATDYGTKQWVNPVLCKAVDIKASSPPSRYTDPKAVVSGQFLNTSFAGPRYIRTAAGVPADSATTAAASSGGSTSTPSTWWQLDLGPKHRLLCNYYTIRHDGSQDGFVRSWVLQGSNDLNHWLDLRRHVNDSSIRLPGQYGSWPVTGPAASMPFRAFRLLLQGPTQSHSNPWAFCLSYWELYGYFYKLGGDEKAVVDEQGQGHT